MAQAEQTSSAPKLFILPKNTSSETRIVTLPNPRTSNPSRYLFCPEQGLYEFKKIAAPKSAPRSLLISRPPSSPPPLRDSTKFTDTKDGEDEEEKNVRDKTKPTSSSKVEEQSQDEGRHGDDISKGYISQTAHLFIATPMDPLFLVLPALAPSPPTTSKKNQRGEMPKQLFLSLDDHLDNLISSSPSSSSTTTTTHISHVLRSPACRRVFEERMDLVCDNVEAGDEKMYRLNEKKLMEEMIRKANVMATGGLPASLEEKFVTRALEVPMTSIKREESSVSNTVAIERDEEILTSLSSTSSSYSGNNTTSTAATTDISSLLSHTSTSTSQETATTTITTTTSTSTTTPASETITHLLRLRTALTYLSTNYLPSHLSKTLLTTLLSSADFTPLNTHLTQLNILRESAINARLLLSDGFSSRKHCLEDDDNNVQAEEKKRRKEEEKRKASSSRALRELRKVDVSGMKKLSDFFGGGGGGGGINGVGGRKKNK